MVDIRSRCAWVRASVTRYLPLTIYMTGAMMKKEVAGTVGGILWWLAEPVFYFFIYYFVFAVVYHNKTEDFAAFLLVGLTIWRWFTMVVIQGTNSIYNNRRLIRQIDVPKIIFPVQALFMETYKFLISFTLLGIFLGVTGHLTWNTVAWFPVVFLVAALLFLGIILVTSALVPLIPDIKNLVRMLLRGLLFLSGVFYEGSHVPERFRALYYMNPLASLLDAFRAPLIRGAPPDATHLGIVFAYAVVIFTVGFWLQSRLNRQIPRYLVG